MPDLLRSVWDEPAPPFPPRRVWRDWALVAVLAPLAVLEGVLRPDLPWRVGVVVLALVLLPTLLWRRTAPLAVVAVGFLGTGLVAAVTGGDSLRMFTLAYLLILPYALLRWGSGRQIVLGLAVVAVKLLLALALGQLTLADTLGGVAFLGTVTALGAANRYRARARARQLDQVKLLERERLARDLHDTVAHHVSAMAIRAQAGIATAAVNPDAAVDALRVIESEASRALAEMRAMVRLLRRDEPADLGPSPRVSDLGRLAGGPPTGPAVDVALTGDVDGLPPSVGAAVYRLAQESVTNARRHARHATRIEVRVDADATSVRLRVSDDGDPAPGRPHAARGYGLIGMTERADLLGGTLAAGPAAGRGWTVTAVLPRTGVAA
ncbi:sensor histidine kinase [Longispora sp. K20-0274]|uniref:sensor histidine kinase n=1 Tax=Longispora sp. K20-0274 TaxID=3088255 RepID=UPI00399B4E95